MRAAILQPGTSAEPADEGIRRRLWTRAEYHRAAELGLFRPEERLELLDGEILEKVSPHNPPHANSLQRVARILSLAFGSGYHVRQQLPLILNGRSEPEPDLVVVAGAEDDFAFRHPKTADTRLVVEISDTTLRLDRGRKQASYARAGVAEYWIVNLPERRLEVFQDPSAGRYRREAVHAEDAIVAPLAQVRVQDLLPLVGPPVAE